MLLCWGGTPLTKADGVKGELFCLFTKPIKNDWWENRTPLWGLAVLIMTRYYLQFKVTAEIKANPSGLALKANSVALCFPTGWIHFTALLYCCHNCTTLGSVAPRLYGTVPGLPPIATAASALWLVGCSEGFLTFQMEPMWPDSVGWFTFCQTRVCEAQKKRKNCIPSRKCQALVAGPRHRRSVISF